MVYQTKHIHIINVRGVGRGMYDKQDGTTPFEVIYILMEFAANGELFDMISNTGKFTEKTARYFFHQLLNVLEHMQNTVGICHRDLKPENVLIDEEFNLKVADFGFATTLKGKNGSGKLDSYKGTLGYMPPEQLAGK